MNPRSVIAAVIASCLLCLHTGTAWAEPLTRRERRAYEEQYEQATRELIVHSSFSTDLILRGTLLTPSFRADLSAQRARLLDPTPDNQARFEARMADDASAYHEVVFSADSGAPTKLLFGPGDDRWNVRLMADGVEQELVTVYRVRNPTPLHYGLYLHINQWSELFIARFNRTVDTPSEVIFHVGSGHGNGQVVWSDLK